MIATRYPCALTGSVLSLAVVFGSAQVASAQPSNDPATEQTLQQMSGLFPSTTNPYAFMHLQNAYNQMLMTLPNDPWGNGYAQRNNNVPYMNKTTPYQSNLFANQPGVGQNSLFPNQPGFAQQAPGLNPNGQGPNRPTVNQFGKKPNQPNVAQQQHHGACKPGGMGQGSTNANALLQQQQNAFQQQQAAFRQQQAAFQQQQQSAYQQQFGGQQHHHHHEHKK